MVALAPAVLPWSGKPVLQLVGTVVGARLGGNQAADGPGRKHHRTGGAKCLPLLGLKLDANVAIVGRQLGKLVKSPAPSGGQCIYPGAANAFLRGRKKSVNQVRAVLFWKSVWWLQLGQRAGTVSEVLETLLREPKRTMNPPWRLSAGRVERLDIRIKFRRPM